MFDVEIHIIYNMKHSYIIIQFKLKIVQNIKVCVLRGFMVLCITK